MADPVHSFSSMLKVGLGERIHPAAQTFVDMLADDAVMEFPYAPPGLPSRSFGRAAVHEHLTRLAKLIAFDRMSQPHVHETSDPETTIIEFEGHGRGVVTNEPYDQRYISVVRTAGGRIVQYRDYWNPLAVLSAVGDLHAYGEIASA